MFNGLFKIDRSMGERRRWQILGAILFIGVIVFMFLY